MASQSGRSSWAGLAAIVVVTAVAYIAFLYILNSTRLSQRLKWNGYFGCARYRHRDIIYGSDFQKKTFEAIASGQRQAWFRDNFAKYGKTFEVNQWGKRIFHTCDSRIAQSILSSQFKNFGLGPSRNPSRPWLGDGIFTTDGESWKSSRNLLKPIFVKTEISDMDRLEKHLSRLMLELASRNYEVDLQTLFLKMYLDYSVDLLFGDDINTVAGNSSKIDADAFITACDQSLLQVVRSQTPWVLRWYNGWTKTWNQSFHASQAFVDRHIDNALGAATHNDDSTRTRAFVDELVSQTGSTDRLYLRNQMLNIFFPARDAAGIAISLVMFQLARHPSTYVKIRHEVQSAGLHINNLTYDAVKGLKYTNAVIHETLRLYGPTGHAFRDVLIDSVLPYGGGFDGDQPLFVPKGSAVIVHMHAIQRDESAWGADAHVFNPDRWLESSTSAQRRAWEYLPFLGGPRICPAQPMVLAQMAYIVARFALQFREIRNRDVEERLIEEHRILMKIRNGVQVKLIVQE